MRKSNLPHHVETRRPNGSVEHWFRKTWTENGKRRARWIWLPDDADSK